MAVNWCSRARTRSAKRRREAKGSRIAPCRCFPSCARHTCRAWNHRRPDSNWVLWNWRDASKPVAYASMNQQLRKLEAKAQVPTIKGRGFHAFRRAIATALVEELGVSHASRVIGDTAEVIMRRYTKPTEQAKAAAMAYLVTTASEPRQGGNVPTAGRPSPAATGTYGTGPAGIEPATPGFGDRCSTN